MVDPALHAINHIGRGAELVTTMDDINLLRYLWQGDRPVDSRIAAACNDDALVAEIFPPLDHIED